MILSSSISALRIIRNSQWCFSLLKKTFVGSTRVNFGCSVKNLSSTTESEKKKDILGSVQVELDGSEVEKKGLEDFMCVEEDYNYDELFKEIAQGDPNVEKQLKKLEFEIALLRDQCESVPTTIKEAHWRRLLELNSVLQRKKFLRYLRVNEYKASSSKLKSSMKRELSIQKSIEFSHGDIVYGVGRNSLLLRVYEKALNNLAFERMLRALMFSQQVVFDCSYDEYMNDLGARYCAHQIAASCNACKYHPYPLHVKLCNVDFESKVYNNLKIFMPNINSTYFPWDIHKESYLDFYPKEKIVYLTPHTSNILHKYNHDDVYIIGAFVDKGHSVKVSLAKAKENNLRMAKLPLDKYLDWKKGQKSLPVNLIMQILLDMRLYNNWSKAFKHVPKRFLTPPKVRNISNDSFV